MRSRVGKVRRSHVVGTYGPGAIVDFRVPGCGAAVSGVLAGLEEWDECARARGTLHPQVVHEPRLEKRLIVDGFRLPPVKQLPFWAKQDSDDYDVLPVVRFPEWLQCPKCNRLKLADDWVLAPGRAERWCDACSDGEDRTYVVPVRFVVACEDGHLGEFPWKLWMGCECDRPELELAMVGPGLGGKVVRCRRKACVGQPTSLEGAFRRKALLALGFRCTGREPWLPTAPTSNCAKDPRVLQRGASNVYWSVTTSSLDIPPFSAELSDDFGNAWPALRVADPSEWSEQIRLFKLTTLTGRSEKAILQMLVEWKQALGAEEPEVPIEWAEYVQFNRSTTQPVSAGEFQTTPEPPPAEVEYYIDGIALASRLREVRAQIGFTRITPPGGMFRVATQRQGKLSERALNWLPAVALRGEGIFLRLRLDRVREWAERPAVAKHVADFNARVQESLQQGETVEPVTAARLLVHSFSHALMRRLSLECGYSSSALRERLYVGDAPHEMVGVLIGTGSPDSEGTLGGLVRQGKADRLVNTILGAIRENAWCSSDPVCITGTTTLSSPRNGAACHACLLVPETSCQFFNLYLDRAVLVGTPTRPDLGFFRDLVDEQQ